MTYLSLAFIFMSFPVGLFSWNYGNFNIWKDNAWKPNHYKRFLNMISGLCFLWSVFWMMEAIGNSGASI